MDNGIINRLITMHKVIENRRRPEWQDINRDRRLDIVLSSEEDYKFVMFIRQQRDLTDNFSVGLRLEAPNNVSGNTLVLVRFQGPHGGQSLTKSAKDLHNDFHIHIFTEADYISNRYKPSYKEPSSDFSSLEEAIVSFLDFCNIEDPYNIFSKERANVNQIRFAIDELRAED